MSRTLRALPVGKNNNLKWYRNGVDASSIHLLKNPPPRANMNYVYETVTVEHTEHWYKVVPKGTPHATLAYEWTFWRESQRLPNGKSIPTPKEGEWYMTVPYTVQKSRRRCVWAPQMYPLDTPHQWDQDAIDLWLEYKRLHRLKYRNGLCRRQRINGVRYDKKSASRRHRRTQDAMAIRDGMNDMGDEWLPSQGSRMKYRKW